MQILHSLKCKVFVMMARTLIQRADLFPRSRDHFVRNATRLPRRSQFPCYVGFFFFFFFFRVSSYYIVNSVCWSHALVNGPTSKRPASDGGLCSGQLLMMLSAVCSGSPHSHAALSASPHFFMDALYRPTPVRSLFRVVQCFRHRSSPLTLSPGSDMWRCTRVGPDASHSCFHVAAIHAS